VAKAVLAHLVSVAAGISPQSVVSWAATRAYSINTLFDYALDRILPEFGGDPEVTPLGLQNTTSILLSAAHRMAGLGMDYAAYYSGHPNPRSANKSVPNGSVPLWNVYDHGVNNAEGALRWPGELYRLAGSMSEALAALDLLVTKLDDYQGQVQGTFCADEVFCGRDPERGTETCTVVETMASWEQTFATLGHLQLMDRVERLAFNALPAALTADMWTHVYVQQANSVYAGVTHPRSTRATHHTRAHDAASSAARDCPRGACASSSPRNAASPAPPTTHARRLLQGGPAAFSEIQSTNYFGVSHFPCCITNFPQGWPKFAQSAVLWQEDPAAVIIASLLPLRATIPEAAATVHIDTAYPFGDNATILVTAQKATQIRVRIPGWATAATMNGKAVLNGTLAVADCAKGNTTISVELNPHVRVEKGWGDILNVPATSGVAVVRGPLVFALHPTEEKTVVRRYTTIPASVGERAPDYLITTHDVWNYALDLDTPFFVNQPSANWSSKFAFDDSGEFPFAVNVTARQVPDWGYWKGSNITSPPPISPVDRVKCGPATQLRLVPFGSTNIRISVFPHV